MSDKQVPRGEPTPQQRNVALAEYRQPTWAEPDWQRFWLTVNKFQWRSLALLPAGEGASPDFTLSLAVTLSRTGMTHLGGPIQVADGTHVPLNQLNAFLAEVRLCTEGGERVIVALSTANGSPTTRDIAKSADGVVLCVLFEHMHAAEARRTVRAIGASKFVGSVIIRPSNGG